MVTVYSKKNCIQCDATVREMQRKGIEHQYVDITEDSQAMETVANLGYKQVPVVIAGEEHWAGFQPDKIGALV